MVSFLFSGVNGALRLQVVLNCKEPQVRLCRKQRRLGGGSDSI